MAGNQNPGVEPENEEEKKKKRRGALWLWWSRYNTWSGRWDWLTWLFSGSPAATATAVLTAGAVATAGVVAYNYAQPEPPPAIIAAAPEPAPAPAPESLVTVTAKESDTSILFPIEGRDKAGRLGKFDVVVLTKKFGWARKSTTELLREGTVLAGNDVLKDIFDDQVRASFAKATAVIAAGVASQEGDPRVETERAGQRAKQSADWLLPVVAPEMPIWTLNLGQYKQPCPDCAASGTDWQRPLIVVAVRELEPEANMGEALADALRGKSNLPSPESYSAYALTKVR